MSEIDQIHVFEDRAFQRAMLRDSAVVVALGVAAGVGWAAAIWGLNAWLGLEMRPFELGGLDSFWTWAISLAVAVAAAFVVHELVHGALFQLFAPPGTHVRYGVDWRNGVAYACAEGVLYTRRHYAIVVAGPTVVVSGALVALGIGLKWPLWTIAAVTVHLSGCTGDWGYLRALRKNPAIAYCEDTTWGVRFYAASAAAGSGPAGAGAPAPAGGAPAARGFEVVDGGAGPRAGGARSQDGATGGPAPKER